MCVYVCVWSLRTRTGDAMLAQRNGLPDLQDVDGSTEGCCFLKPPLLPSPGGCPWAWLAGVDACPSEPYCLWFQLLARAYWGELELGLSGTDGGSTSGSWPWLRNMARRSRLRPWVRRQRSVLVRGDAAGSWMLDISVRQGRLLWKI